MAEECETPDPVSPPAPASAVQQVEVANEPLDVNLVGGAVTITGDVNVVPDGPVSTPICVDGVAGVAFGQCDDGVATWKAYDIGAGVVALAAGEGLAVAGTEVTFGACPEPNGGCSFGCITIPGTTAAPTTTDTLDWSLLLAAGGQQIAEDDFAAFNVSANWTINVNNTGTGDLILVPETDGSLRVLNDDAAGAFVMNWSFVQPVSHVTNIRADLSNAIVSPGVTPQFDLTTIPFTITAFTDVSNVSFDFSFTGAPGEIQFGGEDGTGFGPISVEFGGATGADDQTLYVERCLESDGSISYLNPLDRSTTLDGVDLTTVLPSAWVAGDSCVPCDDSDELQLISRGPITVSGPFQLPSTLASFTVRALADGGTITHADGSVDTLLDQEIWSWGSDDQNEIAAPVALDGSAGAFRVNWTYRGTV